MPSVTATVLEPFQPRLVSVMTPVLALMLIRLAGFPLLEEPETEVSICISRFDVVGVFFMTLLRLGCVMTGRLLTGGGGSPVS